MKDPYEVLSEKYVEVARLRKETEALRLVIEMMEKDDSADIAASIGNGDIITSMEGESLSLCTGTEDN
jgi:hypothetical protein